MEPWEPAKSLFKLNSLSLSLPICPLCVLGGGGRRGVRRSLRDFPPSFQDAALVCMRGLAGDPGSWAT